MTKGYLLVGLGNAPFPLTRHSVGHMVLEYFVRKWKLEWKIATGQGHFTKIPVESYADKNMMGELWLFKPLALMNLCGGPVKRAGNFYDLYR